MTVWCDLIAYLYHETTIIICSNKFTLFQTSIMTDEELDLYWAEIAQVGNITENAVFCLLLLTAGFQTSS